MSTARDINGEARASIARQHHACRQIRHYLRQMTRWAPACRCATLHINLRATSRAISCSAHAYSADVIASRIGRRARLGCAGDHFAKMSCVPGVGLMAMWQQSHHHDAPSSHRTDACAIAKPGAQTPCERSGRYGSSAWVKLTMSILRVICPQPADFHGVGEMSHDTRLSSAIDDDEVGHAAGASPVAYAPVRDHSYQYSRNNQRRRAPISARNSRRLPATRGR